MDEQSPSTEQPAAPTPNLREAVVARIAGSGQEIFNAAVEQIAKETIDKRTALVVQAYSTIDQISKDLKKIKPDQVFYDKDGVLQSENYTKDSLDKRRKSEQRMQKIQNALTKALTTNVFDDLTNAVNSKE